MIRKEEPEATANAVTLGEDAYTLLRLCCPFCGKGLREGCEHRLFVTGLDSFESVKPEFAAYMREIYGLPEGEELDDAVPKPLWPRFKSLEAMTDDAVRTFNGELAEGSSALILKVRNRRRHDRRSVCFASPLGIARLAKKP